MELVLIQAGTFQMGSKSGNGVELPAHKVTITRPFYMGKYEVTQGEWKAVMGTDPSTFKGARNPVENVTWDDCQTFFRKLKEKVPARKFRLPTEAEWEYACRAGSTTQYCYGDDDAGIDDYAWYMLNTGRNMLDAAGMKTHPVGEKKPNAWGLYDMHGNVCEWCQDWYGAYAGDDQKDPAGPANGEYRVLRGGSWYYSFGPQFCRSAFRYYVGPGDKHGSRGFRAVCGVGAN